MCCSFVSADNISVFGVTIVMIVEVELVHTDREILRKTETVHTFTFCFKCRASAVSGNKGLHFQTALIYTPTKVYTSKRH
jgi:hypothetical protein